MKKIYFIVCLVVTAIFSYAHDTISQITQFLTQYGEHVFEACNVSYNNYTPSPETLNRFMLKDFFATNGDVEVEKSGTILYDALANCIFIGFRGSENLADLKRGLYAFQQPADKLGAKGCHVHAGYYDYYTKSRNSLLTQLKAVIKTIPRKQRTKLSLFTCGHSMGGALASIAHADLLHRKQRVNNYMIRVNKTITFGAPKVWCKDAATYFNSKLASKTIRVNHWDDPIQHLSPSIGNLLYWCKHYAHYGQAVNLPPHPVNVNSHSLSFYQETLANMRPTSIQTAIEQALNYSHPYHPLLVTSHKMAAATKKVVGSLVKTATKKVAQSTLDGGAFVARKAAEAASAVCSPVWSAATSLFNATQKLASTTLGVIGDAAKGAAEGINRLAEATTRQVFRGFRALRHFVNRTPPTNAGFGFVRGS